jgi:hypothetical protein
MLPSFQSGKFPIGLFIPTLTVCTHKTLHTYNFSRRFTAGDQQIGTKHENYSLLRAIVILSHCLTSAFFTRVSQRVSVSSLPYESHYRPFHFHNVIILPYTQIIQRLSTQFPPAPSHFLYLNSGCSNHQ